MRIVHILAALVLVATLSLAPGTAPAEQPRSAASTLSKKELEALVEQARKKGVQIIVVAPRAVAQAKGGGSVSRAGAMMAALRVELRKLVEATPGAPAKIWSGLKKGSPDGTVSHHLVVILILIGLMAVAAFVEFLYGRWLKAKMRTIWPAAPDHMASKMCFLLVRFVGRLFGLIVFGAVTVLAATAFLGNDKATEVTAVIMVLSVIGARAMIEFWRVWLSPTLSEFRLPPMSDADAQYLFRWLAGGAIVSGVLLGLAFWFEALGVDRRASVVLFLTIFTGGLIYFLVLFAANRRIVATLIAGNHTGDRRPNRARQFLAASWPILLGAYFLVAWFATSARVALERPNPIGPSFGMLAVLVGALTLYGIAVVTLDWFFYRRKNAPNRIAAEAAAAAAPGDPGSVGITEDEGEPAGGWFRGVRSFEDLAKQSVHLLVFIFVIGGLMVVWGVDVADESSPFVRLWDVIFVLFLGYLAMQSARIWIQKKIEAEGGFDEPEPGEEGAAGGVSRLATLLPLFRNFILATIAVIAIMIGLSELGIDIAPLFAGAGVIGLAIGFGAQTLIRDIFSGAFFLVDDAFRKGEYIDIGDVKGTVERISVRSMQVRHHNGPLHTVPFGEIKYLTNFSRDWVMMKLKLRVTYDTDVDKVRKLIKTLGQELLAHPEIGDKFLQPLKSQGVLAMEDSAMIIRVKFMTKPGDQFVTRKAVYAAIQELFAKEGIKFAHREVTVRVTDEGTPKRRTPAQRRRQAAAGAAVPDPDEELAPAGDAEER